MTTPKSIEHYLADRAEAKDIYNEHDRTHLAIKEKIERRAELIIGIKHAEDGLKKLKNPAFSDQLALSMPSFRFGVSVEFFESELRRQLNVASSELEEIDLLIDSIGDLLGAR